MEKTRGGAIFVSAASIFGGAALQLTGYTNPWWAGFLGLLAVGSLVFAVKPQWASIHLGDRKASEAPESGAEKPSGKGPLFDFEDSDVRMTDTETEGEGRLLRAKGSKIRTKRWWHRR